MAHWAHERFKVPRGFIRWSKKFPLTTSGKLRRDQLKSEVMLHLKLISSSL
ncbi:putative o-succinylbenzoate--CoA ligase [Helianthus annuus]|uniref:O-succinylbenzoate--CoA ligase n=1 Tax=Helianthus annuus TaxID=4232 RepID=A0A251T1A7_HELAN|nr:putative o-succinylbenzoate--CoA ligase [Helianthus annuus]